MRRSTSPTSWNFTTVTALVILSLILAGSLYLTGIGLRNVWRGIASSQWPVAQGVVLQSETGQSVSRDRKTNTSSTMYEAHIVFHYKVDGRDYTTENITFGQTLGSGDSSDAELRRVRYPVNSPVSVSYQPGHPEISAVKPGFDSDALWLPGAGIAIILVTVMFGVLTASGALGSGFVIGLRMFAAIFMLIGVAMLAPGLINIWHAHQSLKWPVAQGSIVYGKIDTSESVTENANSDVHRTVSEGMHLVFQFQVDGRTHYSNTRRFGQLAASSSDWASEIAEQYPVGKALNVAYSPSDPDLAVLEPGINQEAYYLPGAGLAFFLFGLAVLVFGVPALSFE